MGLGWTVNDEVAKQQEFVYAVTFRATDEWVGGVSVR